jgi:hypothetical protein
LHSTRQSNNITQGSKDERKNEVKTSKKKSNVKKHVKSNKNQSTFLSFMSQVASISGRTPLHTTAGKSLVVDFPPEWNVGKSKNATTRFFNKRVNLSTVAQTVPDSFDLVANTL